MNILILHGPNLNLIGNISAKLGNKITLDKINTGVRHYVRNTEIKLKICQTHKVYQAINFIQRNRNWANGLLFAPMSWAQYEYSIVERDPLFTPLHYPDLSIFCFKYNSNSLNVSDSLLNKKITEMIEVDGRVFLSGTKINNENVLRINCVNHRREKKDINFLFKVLKEIGEKAIKELEDN